MSVSTQLTDEGRAMRMRINGRFDFSLHREFRDAYTQTAPSVSLFIVDLSATEYMDSSALGMLLLLREHAGAQKADVEIRNPNEEIRKILTISNFDKLFTLS